MSRLTVPAIALLGLLLTGCAVSVDPAPSESPGAVQSGPDPEALRDELAQIDAGLDDEASVTDADEICAELEQTDTESAIEDEVRERFGPRAESDLSEDQIGQILEAIRGQYCG